MIVCFIHLPIRFFNVDTKPQSLSYLSRLVPGRKLSVYKKKKTAAPRSSSSSSGSAAPRLPVPPRVTDFLDGSPFLGHFLVSTAARLLMLSSLAAPRSSGHFIVSAATRSSGHFVSTAPRSSGHFLVSTTPHLWNQFLVMSEKGTTERPQYNTQQSARLVEAPLQITVISRSGRQLESLAASSVEAQTRYLSRGWEW